MILYSFLDLDLVSHTYLPTYLPTYIHTYSITHHTGEVGLSGQAMLTDDVSLRVFMEHLMKLAVQTP